MLLALASDVTPYKSPDQRRWARAACVWHGTFSSFLWIFKLEAILCFRFGFFYIETTLSSQDGARNASLWSLWSQGEEGSGKCSILSQLQLRMSPGRELALGTCHPWGTAGLTEKQEEALLMAPSLNLGAVPCKDAEGWESWSAPRSAAPSHLPCRRYHLRAAPGGMGMTAQAKPPRGSLG